MFKITFKKKKVFLKINLNNFVSAIYILSLVFIVIKIQRLFGDSEILFNGILQNCITFY